ncbi:N-acetylmuramidase domain-containing protein [Aureimonas mangrovi]|uniref:N-acetylmuramidase domain-containing protein n=1 Tax=Aureimonas mangrovi TaxID=2758041 RepID=UPI00163DA663|nr:N-acetylmuramidase domain-containing protein [Aureimonas mangrovi]
MNFIGTGRRLAQGDVGAAARLINVPTAALLAVMEVEARGSGFDALRRPIILFEPHRFYAELGAGARRDQAVREGLAYARWGAKPYPAGSNAQYARLARAIEIDFPAGLKACSWGLPQILGSNHADTGFSGPRVMVEAFMAGEREQLEGMCRLIAAWGLDAAMRRQDWHAFARRYNGPGYARNAYHTKLATAFAKHSGGEVMDLVASAILRSGSKGEAIRALQADLLALGFDAGPVDGRFGPKTVKAVQDAQRKFGVKADGVVGPATRAVLTKALETADVAPGGERENWPERDDAPAAGGEAETPFDILARIEADTARLRAALEERA